MNLFYRVLRQLVRIGLQIYFKRVNVRGTEKIPKEGPFILAVNHPNSFLEACLLACWLDFPIHFIVRGDVFHPAFRWFFRWTYQIPIYRFRDGFSRMRDNQKTFEDCYRTLSRGQKILIFSEGGTRWEKKLRPIQRGTARMAVGALNFEPDMDLSIVPIGVNYEDVFRFRSSVEVRIGEAMQAGKYKGNEAVFQITEDLECRLRELVVSVEDKDREMVFDETCEYLGCFDTAEGALEQQFDIAGRVNQLSDEKLHQLKQWVQEVRSIGVRRFSPDVRKGCSHWKWFSFQLIRSIFYPLYAGPGILARWVAHRLIPRAEFEVPVRISFGIVFYCVYFALLLMVLGFLIGWWQSVLIAGLILAGVPLYLRIWDACERCRDAMVWKKHEEILERRMSMILQTLEIKK